MDISPVSSALVDDISRPFQNDMSAACEGQRLVILIYNLFFDFKTKIDKQDHCVLKELPQFIK